MDVGEEKKEIIQQLVEEGTKPVAITLKGKYIQLLPYDEAEHAKQLFEKTNGNPFEFMGKNIAKYDSDELVWKYMFDGPFESLDEFKKMMRNISEAPDRRTFAVKHLESNEYVGSLTIMQNVPQFLKIEIGSVFYSPVVQRTYVNTESVYLLLEYLFQRGYRRVEWKCNSENLRSKGAALRLGFTFEGIQQYHAISKGRNRDTAWFRILDYEWPTVRDTSSKN